MSARAVAAFIIFLVILTSPFLVNTASGGLFKSDTKPELELPEGEQKCVEDTDYMRANHPRILKEERNLAVRGGIRTKDHSLNNCLSCHTNEQQFCARCHEYSGVQPACFDCHSTENAGG